MKRYKCSGDLKHQKAKGWNVNLYRNKEKGFIGGVCAGLAEHFDVAIWLVRLLVFGGFLFFNSLAVIIYIALWIFLDPKPQEEEFEYEYDERQRRYRPKKMFQYSDSAQIRLRRARRKLEGVTDSVTRMEKHVTSRKFDLEREFSKLRD